MDEPLSDLEFLLIVAGCVYIVLDWIEIYFRWDSEEGFDDD